MLNHQPDNPLKGLEKDGIVTRTVYPEVPPKVEYALSDMGFALGPALEALVDWTFLRRATTGGHQATTVR